MVYKFMYITKDYYDEDLFNGYIILLFILSFQFLFKWLVFETNTPTVSGLSPWLPLEFKWDDFHPTRVFFPINIVEVRSPW